jgi:hypothetical protein|tara:strand:+ start:1022 stop:1246 length:225 start_codon:yes stop_codon:yes gene_type:complete
MGNVISLKNNEKEIKIIHTRSDSRRMDLEDAMLKECKKKKEAFFIGTRPRPKKERPKTSGLQKRIFNWLVLQDD